MKGKVYYANSFLKEGKVHYCYINSDFKIKKAVYQVSRLPSFVSDGNH